jgi:hypothetical protein
MDTYQWLTLAVGIPVGLICAVLWVRYDDEPDASPWFVPGLVWIITTFFWAFLLGILVVAAAIIAVTWSVRAIEGKLPPRRAVLQARIAELEAEVLDDVSP